VICQQEISFLGFYTKIGRFVQIRVRFLACNLTGATGLLNITGIPVMTNESEIETVIIQLINDLQNEVPEHSFSRIDAVAKSFATFQHLPG
jgi:hypothetical protein